MPRETEPSEATPRRPGPGSAGASLLLRAEDFAEGGASGGDDLRRRIGGWARLVAARLRAFGLELAVCSVDDESGPCALFLACGADSRDARAALVLGIDADGIRAGLELPSAQAQPVRARLSDPARAAMLSAALESLPEQFMVGLHGDDTQIQAPRCGLGELHGLLERAVALDRPLWIGWRVPADVAVEHAALLDEQLEDALVALGRVYLLLTTEVDGVGAAMRPPRARGRSKRSARSTASEDDRDRPSHGTPVGDDRRTNARGRDERRFRDRDGEPEVEVERASEAQARAAKAVEPGAPPRAILRRRSLGGWRSKNDRAPPIERGARVRVLEGAFSGKVGVVHELDGKGGARVMLGLLAVRLDVKNLTASIEGRYRPVLATSHRKPSPARS